MARPAPDPLASAHAAALAQLEGSPASRAAEAALAGLDPGAQALLLDHTRGEAGLAREQLLLHGAEALVAEELLARAGGQAHLKRLRAAGDPAALLRLALGEREWERAAAATRDALPPADVALDPGGLFPRSFPGRATKRRGGHDTGAELVELLLGLSGWDGRGRVLEPAAGSGAFLRAAWARARAAVAPGGAQRELFTRREAELLGLELHPYACRAGRTALALEAARLGLGPADTPRIARADALEPAAGPGTWDLVLGNPPWVRGERLPAAQRAALRARWPELGGGNVDLAAWFVRSALERLAPGGRLAFVLPQGLFEAAACAGLRALLAGRAVEALLSLEWAGPSPFPGAQVIPCLLVVQNAPPAPDHEVALGTAVTGPGPLAERVRWHRLPQRRWLRLSRPAGRRGRWVLGLEPGEARFLRALARAPRAVQAGYGLAIRTRASAGALVGDAAAAAGFAAPRPLLDGREVRPWAIDWSGRWLDWRPEAISDPKSPGFFAAPKLVLPRIALTLAAAVDEGQPQPFYARNTVMVLRAPGTPLEQAPHALAALINSLPLRAWAFRALRAGVLAGSHRATFYARLLQDLPVPAPLLEDSPLVARLERLGRRAAGAARAGEAEQLAALEARIDALVAGAFGLGPRARRALQARAAREPLSRVLRGARAGQATRRIAVRSFEAGARYA